MDSFQEIMTINDHLMKQDIDKDSFLAYLREILKEKFILTACIPILSLLAIQGKKNPDYWQTNDACIMLIKAIGKTEEARIFADFLEEIFNNHFLVGTEDLNQKTAKFCKHFGLSKKSFDQRGGDQILNFIKFALPLIKQGLSSLEEDAIKGVFVTDVLSPTKFPIFCWKLAAVIHQKPESLYQEIDKCIDVYHPPKSLKEFIKIVSCYYVEDFDSFSDFDPTENFYFRKIAEKLKMKPSELLGLVDLLYNKPHSKHIDCFLQETAIKMNIKFKSIEEIRCLIDIFLSKDESKLLHAVKVLKLDQVHFLLLSKIMINPLLISEQQFKEIGITDEKLIEQKNTIYKSSEQNFQNWKDEMKVGIQNSISSLDKAIEKIKKICKSELELIADPNYKDFEFLKKQAKLGLFYLSDFDSFKYSSRNLAEVVETLNNSSNKLRDKILDQNISDISNLQFLSQILNIKLFADADLNFTEAQEKWMEEFAKNLCVELSDLSNFMKMFTLRFDYNTVMESLDHFFSNKNLGANEIYNMLSCCDLRTRALQAQASFIEDNFAQALVFENQNVDFPSKFLKKMIRNDKNIDIPVSELMELVYLHFSKTLSSEDLQLLLKESYHFALFAKGHLTASQLSQMFQNIDRKVLYLLDVLSDSDLNRRQEAIANMFMPKKDKEHPIKIAIAFYGLLTGSKYRIKLRSGSSESENMSIKSYLGTVCNIYPEAFSLFEIILERDLPKFFQKSLPLLRRIIKSSDMNVNLLESIFLLSFKEQFNPFTLANKLSTPPEYITFFIHLARMSQKEKGREKELQEMENSDTFKHVLSKLEIKNKEFTNFVRLLFGLFESEESMKEIISTFVNPINNQAFQKDKGKNSKDINLLKLIVNKPTIPFYDIFRNRKILKSLRKDLNDNEYLDFKEGEKNYLFIISALAKGNFLVLKECQEKFKWVFPAKDPVAERAILKLTMALSGLLNPLVETYYYLHWEIRDFIWYLVIQRKNFSEPVYTREDYPVPNNSLAYATYLAYETLVISPNWIQVFLFHMPAFENLPSELSKEFIVTIVLNFLFMPHIIRDILGLYEWTNSCFNFCDKNGAETSNQAYPIRFKDKIKKIYKILANRMLFKCNELKSKILEISGFVEDYPFIAQMFKDELSFNSSVNQTIFKLYNQNGGKAEEDSQMELDPKKYMQILLGQNTTEKIEENDEEIGELIYQLIEKAYDLLASPYKTKKEDETEECISFNLTDLCILGAISFLKIAGSDNKNLKLYNLHQLCMNIERKMFFHDIFYNISKFKLMKLLAISVGIDYPELFEMCVNDSLFTQGTLAIFCSKSLDYVMKMNDAKSGKDKKLKRKLEKLKHCQEFGFGRSNDEDENKVEIRVGDLGVHPGTYEKYISLVENLAKRQDQIKLANELKLEEAYFIDTEEIKEIEKNYQSRLFCCLEANKFCPLKEIPDQNSVIKLSKSLPSQKINDENKDSKPEDPKTQFLEFENVIYHTKTSLILGIIRNHNIEFKESVDPEKDNNWAILNGLLSLRRNSRFDSRKLQKYLDDLKNDISSNISTLRELLCFLVNFEDSALDETVEKLGMTESVKDFLLVNLRDDPFEKNNSKLISINKKLLQLEKKEMSALRIIKNVYLFKQKSGWMKVVQKLTIANKDKTNDDNPLSRLIKNIDFRNFKKNIKENQGHKTIKSLAFSQELNKDDNDYQKEDKVVDSEIDVMSKIFYHAILDPKIKDNEKTDLARQHETIQSLIQKDFSQPILNLIDSEEEEESKENSRHKTKKDNSSRFKSENQTFLNRLLELLGINTTGENRQSRELFRVFIAVANNNLLSIKSSNKKNMDKIIQKMKELNFFTFKSISNKDKTRLCELLLGTLAWDLELCLKSFDNRNTLKDGNLLYHLYGFLNMDKLLLERNGGFQKAKKHVKGICRFFSENILDDPLKDKGVDPEISLKQEVEKLFQDLQKVGKKPKPYNYYIAKGLNLKDELTDQKEEDNAHENSEFQNMEELTPSAKKMWNICSGEIISKLIEDLGNDFEKEGRQHEALCAVSIVQNLITLEIQITKFYNQREEGQKNKNDDEMKRKKLEEEKNVLASTENLLNALKQYSELNKLINDEFMELVKENDLIHLHIRLQNAAQVKNNFDVGILKKKAELIFKGPDLEFVNQILDEALSAWKKDEQKRKDLLDIIIQILFPYGENSIFTKDLEQMTELSNKIKKIYNDGQQDSDFHSLKESVIEIQKSVEVLINGNKGIEEIKEDHIDIEESLGIYFFEYEPLKKLFSDQPFDQNTMFEFAGNFSQAKDIMARCSDQKNEIVPFKISPLNANFNSNELADIMKKIKDGKASSTDLFKVLDAEGDKNGSISETEFSILANRLGLRLSKHRIKEIFAKVKGNKDDEEEESDLNEKEFGIALGYLQEKNLSQALQFLGITPEILIAILIRLTIILILIFLFIFLGIKAFAIGGTFGSIINSLFPAGILYFLSIV